MLEDVPKSGSHVARTSLLVEIRALKEAIHELENGDPNNEKHIKGVVEIASRIAKRNESLTKTLKRAGYNGHVERKEIRQIKGIANYHHCCNRLCDAARAYRTTFGSMKLNTIPAYPVEKWPKQSGIKHFVHAEIQLLVHHEMNSAVNSPRCIGVSKRACFLYYCFMRGHGSYTAIETHGELHEQWTVPDRDDYSESSRDRLSTALLTTKKDVESALVLARVGSKRLAPQLQSPDHSVIFSLKTASAPTLRIVSKIDSAHTLVKDMPDGETNGQSTSTSTTTAASPTVLESSGSSNSICHISAPSREHGGTDRLKSTTPSIVDIDWLTLFIPDNHHANTRYATAENSNELSDANVGAVCNASQTLNPSACASAQVIRIANLDMGKTIRLNGVFTDEVDVIFVHEGEKDIGVHLIRLLT
jgi:hypothetical protein